MLGIFFVVQFRIGEPYNLPLMFEAYRFLTQSAPTSVYRSGKGLTASLSITLKTSLARVISIKKLSYKKVSYLLFSPSYLYSILIITYKTHRPVKSKPTAT
jgi:hypothetical protein